MSNQYRRVSADGIDLSTLPNGTLNNNDGVLVVTAGDLVLGGQVTTLAGRVTALEVTSGAVANATDDASAITQLNAILAILRTRGIIAP